MNAKSAPLPQVLPLAHAAARLSNARARTAERRRFRRMPLTVSGRMLDSAGREYDCRTADLSPGDVRLTAPALPAVGERVVLYLEEFGRVAGRVSRQCGEHEVAIVFESSAHKQEKLAEKLTWVLNKHAHDDAVDEALGAAPTPGQRKQMARIELESGEMIAGEVLDLSLSGMTVRSNAAPALGMWVRFGGVYGRVARRIEGGFAIDFAPRGLHTTQTG